MVISIEYEDGNPQVGEQSVSIFGSLTGDKVFDTGDFVKDWYNAMEFALKNLKKLESLSFSSSVYHFVSDGALYEEKYLSVTGEKPELIDTQKKEGDILMFIPKGRSMTWKELKTYSKTK